MRTDEKYKYKMTQNKATGQTHPPSQGSYTKKDRSAVKTIKTDQFSHFNTTSQYWLFMKIWNEREHVSFLSGKPINISPDSAFWFNIFAHVLSKALNKYPKYKLYEKNIVLLLPTEHTLYDHGTIEQREKYAKENNCDWQKIYDLADELKKQYPNIY